MAMLVVLDLHGASCGLFNLPPRLWLSTIYYSVRSHCQISLPEMPYFCSFLPLCAMSVCLKLEKEMSTWAVARWRTHISSSWSTVVECSYCHRTSFYITHYSKSGSSPKELLSSYFHNCVLWQLHSFIWCFIFYLLHGGKASVVKCKCACVCLCSRM